MGIEISNIYKRFHSDLCFSYFFRWKGNERKEEGSDAFRAWIESWVASSGGVQRS